MRVIVAGRLEFDGADCVALIRAAAGFIAGSRAEAGCVAYNFSLDPLVPHRVHVFEEWESEPALLAHFRDPSYAAMRAHLQSFTLSFFDVQVYGVSGVEPVYNEDGTPRSALFGIALP